MTVTLTEAKQHLRVTHNLEDGLIQLYLDAAVGHLEKYLGDDLPDPMPDPMPDPIRAAVLLLAADLYINRDRQADRALFENTAYGLLLAPYRSAEVL